MQLHSQYILLIYDLYFNLNGSPDSMILTPLNTPERILTHTHILLDIVLTIVDNQVANID